MPTVAIRLAGREFLAHGVPIGALRQIARIVERELPAAQARLAALRAAKAAGEPPPPADDTLSHSLDVDAEVVALACPSFEPSLSREMFEAMPVTLAEINTAARAVMRAAGLVEDAPGEAEAEPTASP